MAEYAAGRRKAYGGRGRIDSQNHQRDGEQVNGKDHDRRAERL